MAKKWYENAYRRHLMDMHIEDWSDEFFSKLDVDKYYENLVKAKIQSPMIYFQSHVGLCYYDTKTGKKHRAFEKDNKIKRLVKKCIDGGMKVVGYYSLTHNTWAEINHPDWAMKYESGLRPVEAGSRYGLCCINNQDYLDFTEQQIKEFSEQFEGISGVFYDMPFWPLVCRCDACKKRWAEEVGGEMPTENVNDERWLLYVRKSQIWMGEYTKWIKDITLKYMPNVTVEFNYAGAVAFTWPSCGSTELINDNCEFAGGDLYGDLYNHSFTAKYYSDITRNKPFEYMVCRCDNVLQEHTISKTYDQLKTEMCLTAAHHGANFIIDAIDPRGTMDDRVYETLGHIFDYLIPFEKYYEGDLLADVGVFYDTKTIFNTKRGYEGCNRISAINATRTLIENHVPVTVIANPTLNKAYNYKAVVAGELENFYPEYEEIFIDYVKNGGTLYLSGRSNFNLMKEFFGAEFKDYTVENRTFIRPANGTQILGEFTEQYPLPINYCLPIYEVKNKDVIIGKITLPYTDPKDNLHYASIHSNPPGIDTEYPGMMMVSYGKGKVIWSAAAIEQEKRMGFKKVFMNVIRELVGQENFSLTAKLSSTVETVTFKNDGAMYISMIELVNHEDHLNKDFILKVKTTNSPKKVLELPTEKEISFEYKDGYTVIRGVTENFSMLKIVL